MPEGDRFEKIFQPGWRSAFRWARAGNATSAELADKLVKSLTKTLRDGDGIPAIKLMQEVVGNMDGQLALPPTEAVDEAAGLLTRFNALDRIVRDVDGHRIATVAAEVAKTMIVRQGGHDSSVEHTAPANSLYERVCFKLVEHYFFANASQFLVQEGNFNSHDDARRWREGIEKELEQPFRAVAKQLEKNRPARYLRAPNRTVKPQSTGDLLGENLISASPTERPRDVNRG